jgi:hypothetical protein
MGSGWESLRGTIANRDPAQRLDLLSILRSIAGAVLIAQDDGGAQFGTTTVPKLRAVLVTVPPLLADLIRHVLISRVGVSIIAEIADPETATERLRALGPDVVIIGPAASGYSLDSALVRLMLPGARVLTLSADLNQLFGPGEADVNDFTPQTLADCLRR